MNDERQRNALLSHTPVVPMPTFWIASPLPSDALPLPRDELKAVPDVSITLSATNARGAKGKAPRRCCSVGGPVLNRFPGCLPNSKSSGVRLRWSRCTSRARSHLPLRQRATVIISSAPFHDEANSPKSNCWLLRCVGPK